ncbi:MAG: phosphoribosylanthranilate isomerase [Solobacterium sp.]|nr:phosphoribosylanthranilate isomerase [Solobacterium sp.]
MTRIKICGLRRPEDIEAVNRYQPDYCGFILSRPFRRYVSIEELRRLREMLSAKIIPVGVFVDEDLPYIARFLDEQLISAVQLHGSEPEELIRKLQVCYPKIPVIKAFTIRSETDAQQAVQSCADMILLDSGKGSGMVFDWKMIRDTGRPYFLAGGLNEENISDALAGYHPYAVDVSSGAETDGWKDPGKIARLIRTVRRFDGENYDK